MLGFFLMLSQVPASACVKNKGWKSYWNKQLNMRAELSCRSIKPCEGSGNLFPGEK